MATTILLRATQKILHDHAERRLDEHALRASERTSRVVRNHHVNILSADPSEPWGLANNILQVMNAHV